MEPTVAADRERRIEEIRTILALHARLPVDSQTLPTNADLYEAGMSSHAGVNVMLALEDCFEIEFPDHMLRRSVFESIDSIQSAVGDLTAEVPT